MKFDELDVVVVLKDVNEKITEGMSGTIVYTVEGTDYYEVEFLDFEGYTIDLVTIEKENLRLEYSIGMHKK